MTLLDDVLRGDIRKLLLGAGYSGRGKTMRRPGLGGSIAMIEFVVMDGIISKSVVEFTVQFGVFVPTPRPWLSEDLQHDLSARQRHIADCQAYAYLWPSPQSAWTRINGGNYIGTWGLIDTEPNDFVKLDLLEGLRVEVLPLLDHLQEAQSGIFVEQSTRPRIAVAMVRSPFTSAQSDPVLDGGLYSWPEPNPSSTGVRQAGPTAEP